MYYLLQSTENDARYKILKLSDDGDTILLWTADYSFLEDLPEEELTAPLSQHYTSYKAFIYQRGHQNPLAKCVAKTHEVFYPTKETNPEIFI